MGEFLKKTATILAITGMLFSCSSDDSDSGSESGGDCPTTITDQVAQGNFRGDSFVSPGGVYRQSTSGRYSCKIFAFSPTSTESCYFPDFGGMDDTILFGLDTASSDTFRITEEFNDNEGGTTITVNFNRIEDGFTTAELSCGTLIINGLNTSDQLTGSIRATGVDGSTINGNFVLDFCD